MARFLAVLIYDDGDDRRSVEPRVYEASHPEIAYRLALIDGSEERYGRTFVGLSHLEESDEEVPPITRSEHGDAAELVVAREELPVFTDPKWQSSSHDEEELEAATAEPPPLMEIKGLDDIPWETLTHAYGPATDVPTDIRRLVSSDAELRERAVWQLFGSIYHQGTLYPATTAAVPFILDVLANTTLPDREPIAQLVESLAESAAVDPEVIERAWKWRIESFGEIYDRPAAEMANEEIESYRGVFERLTQNLSVLRELAEDPDTEVARQIQTALEHIAAST